MHLLQVRSVLEPFLAELAITEPVKHFLHTAGWIPLNLLYRDSKCVIFIPGLSGIFPSFSFCLVLQLHGTTDLPYRASASLLVLPPCDTSPLTMSYVQSLPITWVTGEFQPHTNAVKVSGIQSFQLKKCTISGPFVWEFCCF